MNLELSGRVALVTGSSRGIGLATAEAFLREGAHVCICARGEVELQQARHLLEARGGGGKVTAVQADVTRTEGAQKAVAHTLQTLGTLDVLVNNVGGSRGTGTFDQVSEARFREVMDLNLSSTVLCSWPAVEWMKAHGGGAIVNIGSIYGREYASSSAYTAAKAAITALTKEMAVDLARFGIRVNSVAPGSVLFPGGSWDKRGQQNPELIRQMLDEQLPWKRFGRPEEVAEAVVFLSSVRASWVSGVSLPVDGAQGRAF